MHYRKPAFLVFILALQGCSSLLPDREFVPSDPEALNEWSMEGSIEISDKNGSTQTHFEFRQIDDQLTLYVRPKSPVAHPTAEITAIEGEESSTEINHITAKARMLAETINEHVTLDELSYWLRALPYSDEAEMKADEDEGKMEKITESGWEITYKDFMQIDRYYLPERMVMEKGDVELELSMVRAETGYLSSPCPGGENYETDFKDNTPRRDVVAELVPLSGAAPLPRWINDADFCKQLFKIHGKIPESRVGLYGPDSMMWRLTGPVTPAGIGAGRALLLQTAHPWVTAGIDEHSIVRYDPLERARRTFIYISTMVYGSMPQVMGAANTVHQIHNEIEGELPYEAGVFKEHSEYRANEVAAMIWVHATLWDTIVRMYEKLEGPLTPDEKEKFYEETKLFAMLFGIPESALPRDWDEFIDYNESMWLSPQLTVTENAKVLKEDLFNASFWLAFPLWVQEVITAANLPPTIREGYDMDYGLWEQFNYSWILFSAKMYNWVLPDSMGKNPVYHEANARLRGERVGGYQQSLIKAAGVERLVN